MAGTKTVKVKELSPKQIEAAYYMGFEGMSQDDIAAKLGVAQCTVSRWNNSENFQEEVRKNVYKKFGKLAVKATKRMEELIDSGQDAVAFAACKEVLNKAGFKEVEKVEQSTTQTIKVDVTDTDE